MVSIRDRQVNLAYLGKENYSLCNHIIKRRLDKPDSDGAWSNSRLITLGSGGVIQRVLLCLGSDAHVYRPAEVNFLVNNNNLCCCKMWKITVECSNKYKH